MIAVTNLISRFFVWWLGELASCVPAAVRELFRQRSAFLALDLGAEDLKLSLHQGSSVRDLGRIRLDATSDPRQSLAPLLRGVPLRDVDIVLNLPSDRVLRRRVTLPLAAQENLREVLAFEMDRHTPFKAGDVAFDFRVAGTDLENKKLIVELAVIPGDLVERAAGLADSLELALDRIGIIGDPSQDGRELNLLPHGNANGHSSPRNRLLVGLAVLAAILVLIASYLPLYGKQRTLAAYEAQLADRRAAALETEQLKQQLAAREERGRFLIDRRLSTPPAMALLAELTERLPDDTWLIQMGWQGDKLTIAGFSPAAAALIADLEESPLLSEVRFGSPVTADPRVGNERFNISADVAPISGE
jgi:general secretion pathway protein L